MKVFFKKVIPLLQKSLRIVNVTATVQQACFLRWNRLVNLSKETNRDIFFGNIAQVKTTL